MKALFTLLLAMGGLTLAAQEVRTENYEDGQVKTQYTVFGNYVEVTAFYQDGTVKETGSYLNHKPHGEYRQYNTKGEMISSGTYENGKKEGVWLYRNGDGDELYEVHYRNNQRVDVDRWVAAE